MENTLYFAYGSNINLGQMEYRCPNASVMGPVTLENYELLYDNMVVLTAVKEQPRQKKPKAKNKSEGER